MAPPMVKSAFSQINSVRSSGSYTTTALKRWSCLGHGALPNIQDIRAIHVYDFDNTLFCSPLPNPQLWNGPTIGFLQSYECFATGGWWHDPKILGATGKGLEIEEPLAWKGWWNEQIVQLVELSMKQKDALTVLLTGRGEGLFADLIKRMVKSKGLQFDLVCLKPEVGPNSQRFSTTMKFKQCFLEDLIFTYKDADELRIYEDRVNHVKGFRDYLEVFNRALLTSKEPNCRKPITADVIHVGEEATRLNPVAETAEIQRMVDSHNLALRTNGANITKSPYGRLKIKKVIFYTGYMLSNEVSARLIQNIAVPLIPPNLADAGDIKFMANSILITPRSTPRHILAKVGGMGKTVRWRVTGVGVFENKLWAARVTPVPESERIHTDNPEPVIVLALRKGARPVDAGRIRHWEPVSNDNGAFVFDATVGEKITLRVEEEHLDGERGFSHSFKGNSNKRRFPADSRDDADVVSAPRDNYDMSKNRHEGPEPSMGRHQNYNRNIPDGGSRYHPDENSRRGGGHPGYRGNRGRGGRGGRGGGRGRGRGAHGGRDGQASWYKSWDDHAPGGYDGPGERGPATGGNPVMNY